MSMGRRAGQQTPMWVAASELSRSEGHRFYEKLNELLAEAEFDRGVEQLCAPYFELDGKAGRPSVAPGVYFRMLFVGYFEGIESERGLEWRCSDSLSLRTFLGVLPSERVPDHSTLSRTRTRLNAEVYDAVFRLVLGIVEAKGLLRGKVASVDSTYLRADASMKSIVRKNTGDDYATYLKKLCEEQGIKNPTVEDARRMDRKRKVLAVLRTVTGVLMHLPEIIFGMPPPARHGASAAGGLTREPFLQRAASPCAARRRPAPRWECSGRSRTGRGPCGSGGSASPAASQPAQSAPRT